MSPEQSRAARGWLAWSREDLATRAKVSISTVKDFENGARKPISNNLAALRTAFEAAGMRLLFDGERAIGVTVASDANGAEATTPLGSPQAALGPRKESGGRARRGKPTRR